ncbi:hypothetical protein WR25_04756 [Diploscapter pachys]|uniref:Uncharacterized protein n=1 Tax=Diploscapter pachys TaxID=2018661 RepID=A0A2A2KS38_9BILA|nr:hypothetical protein WR25_04756 [Diploscapter pachys]
MTSDLCTSLVSLKSQSIFASSGFGCKNNLGDTTCASFFGLPPIEKSDGPDRSPGCFTYSGDPNAPVDQAAKQYAVDNWPIMSECSRFINEV